ncbi:MAG TPA: dienelactone hydrolase family protein [Steroidobacteraceae bacterium]|jgi:dienelactone hydrolase|nr:dienelactone hydrolase family protein [Steroidobacteraceae bacterium]
MRSETLKYQSDGLSMSSELFYEPGGGRKPAVLVFPEAFGLGEHALARAKRLAELGYAALACDLHGERRILTDLNTVMQVVGALRDDVSRTRARGQTVLDVLKGRAEVDATRIAAIGYCFGGTMALELARSGAPIVGAVGFHSGLSTTAPQDAKNIKGKVLVCIGADDPSITPEQRAAFEQEMTAGKVNWQMSVFGRVVHSFTNPDADKLGRSDFARYDEQADARSWQQMRELLAEVFE